MPREGGFIDGAFWNSDFQNDAQRSYPVYPAVGGTNWRAQIQPIIVFDWDYVSALQICSDDGMYITMRLQHDTPFTGWFATVTFYCTSGPCT